MFEFYTINETINNTAVRYTYEEEMIRGENNSFFGWDCSPLYGKEHAMPEKSYAHMHAIDMHASYSTSKNA